MAESAKNQPQLLHPEQVSAENLPEQPWLRQKNEPALWYMRFRRWLDLGPRRTLEAAINTEPDSLGKQKPVKQPEPGKPHKVMIPGSWSRAARVWNWKARAEAYDLVELEREAALFRETTARTSPFASRSYRISTLDLLAGTLRKLVAQDQPLKDTLAITDRLQSLMRDIAHEMEGLESVAGDVCDVGAASHVKEGRIISEYAEKLEDAQDEQEREKLLLERTEALEKLIY